MLTTRLQRLQEEIEEVQKVCWLAKPRPQLRYRAVHAGKIHDPAHTQAKIKQKSPLLYIRGYCSHRSPLYGQAGVAIERLPLLVPTLYALWVCGSSPERNLACSANRWLDRRSILSPSWMLWAGQLVLSIYCDGRCMKTASFLRCGACFNPM